MKALYITDQNCQPELHNYYRKLGRLLVTGKLPKSKLSHIDVRHDDWCQVFIGGYCDCKPEIWLEGKRVS